jgi:hypothetical protein
MEKPSTRSISIHGTSSFPISITGMIVVAYGGMSRNVVFREKSKKKKLREASKKNEGCHERMLQAARELSSELKRSEEYCAATSHWAQAFDNSFL